MKYFKSMIEKLVEVVDFERNKTDPSVYCVLSKELKSVGYLLNENLIQVANNPVDEKTYLVIPTELGYQVADQYTSDDYPFDVLTDVAYSKMLKSEGNDETKTSSEEVKSELSVLGGAVQADPAELASYEEVQKRSEMPVVPEMQVEPLKTENGVVNPFLANVIGENEPVTEIKVDDNIAMPVVGRNGAVAICPYPLASMGVGQSFAVPEEKDVTLKNLRDNVALRIGYYRKRDNLMDRKFKALIYTRPADGVQEVRVWRTA